MRQETFFENNQGLYFGNRVSGNEQPPTPVSGHLERLGSINFAFPRQTVIGMILVVALLAFEIFNFDTTQYALTDLLGEASFIGLRWATILAIAFCAIDFAGLAHLFTPERGTAESKEVWYLMGAWLLGATMNALMTWWAISLTLLNHEFGNEVLSREQLLQIAPIFVAVLVWLTRILFIGAFSVAGDHLFQSTQEYYPSQLQPATRPIASPARPAMATAAPKPQPVAEDKTTRSPRPVTGQPTSNGRVRQRPPRPGANRTVPATVMAKGRQRN